VKAPPAGRSLSDMLVAGELEAIYSPPRPAASRRSISWCCGARRGRPTAGSPGTEAFTAANDCFGAAQRGFPYATPWLEAELEDTAAVMGEDFHPYGFEPNRARIEMFAAEAFRLGLTSRQITPDEYFADYLSPA
jgi:4,5-dihydroxyphthalate decarboxylase